MPDTLTSHQPVAVAWDPAHATLTVAGELDCGTGPHLLAAALEVAERRPPLVELDLARVSFVDSAGWRAVGAALDACAEAGALVTISRRSPCVERFERVVDSAAATPSAALLGRSTRAFAHGATHGHREDEGAALTALR